MALPTSGTISINDLRAEFGDSGSSSLSEFYRGGGLVPATETTTTYDPGPGTTDYEYSLTSPLDGWVQDRSSPYTNYLYWDDVEFAQFTDSDFNVTSSYTHTDGWTYIRKSTPTSDPIDLGDIIVSVFEIRRQQSTTININTDVPTSGTISLNDFYGATA